ncbi:hypothetical protein, partial [Cronobacter sakazakii]|uniref:hypothetical protein n=1 Tax=Cronobacter sakazakii TaxID=28141 RepID=UPI0015C492A1
FKLPSATPGRRVTRWAGLSATNWSPVGARRKKDAVQNCRVGGAAQHIIDAGAVQAGRKGQAAATHVRLTPGLGQQGVRRRGGIEKVKGRQTIDHEQSFSTAVDDDGILQDRPHRSI